GPAAPRSGWGMGLTGGSARREQRAALREHGTPPRTRLHPREWRSRRVTRDRPSRPRYASRDHLGGGVGESVTDRRHRRRDPQEHRLLGDGPPRSTATTWQYPGSIRLLLGHAR